MENTPTHWQRLSILTRQFVAPLLNGRTGARLLCTLALVTGLALPALQAQTGTGRVTGRVLNLGNSKYVANAVVSVEGTTIETLTNGYGEYLLNGVPAGEAKVRVMSGGLDTETVTVTVPAGGSVNQDFDLTSAERYGDDKAVKLDTFVVQANREYEGNALATNEQRYAPSIKNVISADAFGDVTEGNVGEFMKFLPGVTVDYVAADVRTMSVRGFADNFTPVSIDGSRMASASSGASSRSFEFEQVSMNNISRIELSKTSTPSMPADSLGGGVNLVSKSALERKGAQFKYRAYLSINSEDMDFFTKTPGPMDKKSFKVRPGFDFDYTLPVNKHFGLVITGLSSNQFNEQHRSQKAWNFAQAGATPANPYLQQYLFQDGPKNTYRDSVSVKGDWRIAPNQVLSGLLSYNYYLSQFGNRNITFNAGTNNVPTPATGTPLTYSSTMTSGATGRGAVQGQTSFRDKYGATIYGMIGWTYKAGDWNLGATANASKSKTWYRDTGRDHFSEVRTNMANVSRVVYEDINEIRPGTIRVLNAAGAELDPAKLSNYTVTFGRGNPIDAHDIVLGLDLNAKRAIGGLPFPAWIKTGLSLRKQERDIRRYDESWNLAGTVNGAGYIDQNYRNQDSYWGLPGWEWPDAYALYALLRDTPAAYAQTDAQKLAAERFRRQNSQHLEETISALFLEGQAKFINNRLNVVTGVRFEQTDDSGRGALVKGPITTMAQVQTNMVERGFNAEKKYDNLYPSLNISFNVTKNLILRAAYARTLGRPDLPNMLPSVRVNDTATTFDDGLGNINPFTVIATTGDLKPYDADSYDLMLEYYFAQGGVLSGGVFRKNLSDFFGLETRTVTAGDIATYGLDASTLGFAYQSQKNIGNARIDGGEINYQQPLSFLPGLGRNFSIFANGTKLNLDGPNSADFAKFIEESASWGLTFSRKPIVVQLKWNYRGRQVLAAQTGGQYGAANGFREYYKPRTFLDVNAEYQFSKRFTLFANARNVFNVEQTLQRYNDVSPEYSRTYRIEEFGVQMAVGLKGTF